MTAAAPPAWNLFKQIFAEHWDGFKHVHPRYHTRYYDSLVDKMLRCGDPEKIGFIENRCLHCGQGKHLVAMSCKSSLCLPLQRHFRALTKFAPVESWFYGRK